MVLFQEISCAFYSKFSASEKVVYKFKVFDIYRPEVPVTFFIFSGLKYIKF